MVHEVVEELHAQQVNGSAEQFKLQDYVMRCFLSLGTLSCTRKRVIAKACCMISAFPGMDVRASHVCTSRVAGSRPRVVVSAR